MRDTTCISIDTLEKLLEAAKAERKRVNGQCTSIVKITKIEPSDTVGNEDKLEFRLESAWAECHDWYLYVK